MRAQVGGWVARLSLLLAGLGGADNYQHNAIASCNLQVLICKPPARLLTARADGYGEYAGVEGTEAFTAAIEAALQGMRGTIASHLKGVFEQSGVAKGEDPVKRLTTIKAIPQVLQQQPTAKGINQQYPCPATARAAANLTTTKNCIRA